MSEVIFTEEDYFKMEKESRNLLGWSLTEKTGMSLKAMIENPEQGKAAIKTAKETAGWIDRYKLGKLLEYLEDPNWKQLLKDKLS